MKADPNYFRFPKPIEGTLIAFLMVIFYFAFYQPSSVVLDWVGPVGSLARYLNKNQPTLLTIILYAAIAAHAGEAVYARILCKHHSLSNNAAYIVTTALLFLYNASVEARKGINTRTTIMWMVQTFIMGFPSLLQLVAYRPGKSS